MIIKHLLSSTMCGLIQSTIFEHVRPSSSRPSIETNATRAEFEGQICSRPSFTHFDDHILSLELSPLALATTFSYNNSQLVPEAKKRQLSCVALLFGLSQFHWDAATREKVRLCPQPSGVFMLFLGFFFEKYEKITYSLFDQSKQVNTSKTLDTY